MGLFFGCCGRWTFCVCSGNFKKSVEKLIKICHTKIMHLRGKEFCTIYAAKKLQREDLIMAMDKRMFV